MNLVVLIRIFDLNCFSINMLLIYGWDRLLYLEIFIMICKGKLSMIGLGIGQLGCGLGCGRLGLSYCI